MIDTIYVEHDIATHPRTQDILAQFPQATMIKCERYGEVFNRRAQNFRLQKRNPGLIIARKHKRFVLPTPPGYGIGGQRNFYFSHMLNCVYDCRYCFLQGMYQAAHYVIFVNYEDFAEALHTSARAEPKCASYYFSGYDCDSLALDRVTHFVDFFLPVFERLDQAWLELRTKSVQIGSLAQRPPLPRVVVAFSLSPAAVASALDHRTPTVERRIDAMAQLATLGWKIGIRFDPLIYYTEYQQSYRELFDDVFSRVPLAAIHSVSLGALRFPKAMFDKIVGLYPDERLFAGPLRSEHGMVSYRSDLHDEMYEFCRQALLNKIAAERLFMCESFLGNAHPAP